MRVRICSAATLTVFGLVALNASFAAAQQLPSAGVEGGDKAERSDGTLEEIIVTAERRTTRLQDTPLAITVFDDSIVERARIQTMVDLVPRIPGFSISTNSRFRLNPALRGGASSLTAPASDQAVAVFVEGASS